MNIPTNKSSRRPSTMTLQVECIILKLCPADSRLESGRVCEKIRVVKNSVDPTRPDQKLDCNPLIIFFIFFIKIPSF